MKLQPGLLVIAQMAQVPIISITFSATRVRRARSWDRFLIPLPFGKIYYHMGMPQFNPTPEVMEKEMLRLVEEGGYKSGTFRTALKTIPCIPFYRALTSLASPFVPLLLNRRLSRGKENSARLQERPGIPIAGSPRGQARLDSRRKRGRGECHRAAYRSVA